MPSIQEGLSNVFDRTSSTIKGLLGNPAATAVGGAIVGGAITGTTIAAVRSRKKGSRDYRRKSRKSSRRVRRKRVRRKKRSYRYARTARKRKDTSRRRIRMTKNGQPYVILRSGKARFISKRSASTARRRKGGRY